jgi:hypothetical protein
MEHPALEDTCRLVLVALTRTLLSEEVVAGTALAVTETVNSARLLCRHKLRVDWARLTV